MKVKKLIKAVVLVMIIFVSMLASSYLPRASADYTGLDDGL